MIGGTLRQALAFTNRGWPVLPCLPGQTAELAKIPTRLKQLDAAVQERLIDWGYAICDAALRKHFDPAFPKATRFPFQRGV